MSPAYRDSITAIEGLKVGHAGDFAYYTGCTVILCEEGAVGGVDIRGTAAGTRQIDSLFPHHLVGEVHAIVLSGGSAFGLDAASGVVKYLEERQKGYNMIFTRVPIVPTAVLFDLAFWDFRRRPDAAMGYQAASQASAEPVTCGSVGAGVGATVGKLYGVFQATKGGVGSACVELAGGVKVGALAAVNAFGDVYDPASGKILAGARKGVSDFTFADTTHLMKAGKGYLVKPAAENTTLVVVATNASLDKLQTNRLARMAQNGLIKTISPIHSPFDGDVVFALSYGSQSAELSALGLAAEEAVSIAIQRAVKEADGFGLLPAYRDLQALRN